MIEASDYITEAGLSQSATKLVPPRTTLVAITGATLGQITITEIAACINQSLVAILGTDDLPTEYLYFWLQERIGDLVASQTGAAQQHVNKNDVNALWIMIPPRPEISGLPWHRSADVRSHRVGRVGVAWPGGDERRTAAPPPLGPAHPMTTKAEHFDVWRRAPAA